MLLLSGCAGGERAPETTAAPATTRPSMIIQAPETTAPTTTTAPPPTAAPAPAPEVVEVDAEALFIEKCSVCHSYTRAASKRKSRSQWEGTVDRMVTANGGRTRAGITDEEAALIVEYLAENYGS